MSAPRISVVVCTHNRADLLASALDSLQAQQLAAEAFEIVVVDNNSRDRTRTLVEELQLRTPNLRYVLETMQGLSHARNAGWRAAQGEYVAYIDDDCRAPETWLAAAAGVIDRVAPTMFGGPYYPFYLTPRPRWFRDDYGAHVLYDASRELGAGEFLDGGNMFLRRDVLARLGGFRGDLGMSGTVIAYGEETALQQRVRAEVPRATAYYDPAVFVYHLVRAEKMTLRRNARESFAAGRAGALVFGGAHRRRARARLAADALRTAARFAASVARGAVLRDRTRFPYVQNYVYEHAFGHLQHLGALAAEWRADPARRETV